MRKDLCRALVVAAMSLTLSFSAAPAHAQGGTVVASDNFDRADENPFAISGNWGRTIAGNYDGYSTLANSQVYSASNEGIYYWKGAGTFSSTQQFARERVVQKDGEVGLVLLGGSDQAIMVGWGPPGVGSTVYIYWYSNGLDRGQLATGPSSLVNGDIIEAVLDGGTIFAKVNGVTVLSVANTTTLTSGAPGFITYLNPGLPGLVAIMDDWEAGTPASYSISGTITEDAAGLSGVLVTASGGYAGSTTTNGAGVYTLTGVAPNATSIVLTPSLLGHAMSPLTRTITGPVTADVTGQDFTSTASETPDVIASDDFDRADETPLALGGNWLQPFGGGSVNLSGNHAVSAGGEALYYWAGAGTFDNAQQFARLKVDNAAGQVGLVLLGASNHALVVSWNAGTLFVYWYNGGAYQGNLTTMPSTLQNGDVIEALLDGGVIYAKRNGVLLTSVANTTPLNFGRPGFETYQTGAALDDWEGGSPQPNNDVTLTIVAHHGSVTKDPDQTVFTNGVTVTLTPHADAGFGFAGWSGDVPLGDENDDPLVLTMDQDRTVTARFLPPNLIAFDDFDRANETPLAVGANWQRAFGVGTVNLAGNRIASAGGEALYYWQGAGTFDNSRQFARATVINAGGQVGMVLLGATNQALVVSWGGGRLYIYWYLNGSHQGELVNEAMVLHDGDEIEGMLENGVIYAKINGVVVRSVANTTSLTSGRPGFETYLTGAIFDDWEAGTPPSYSISGTITENAVGRSGVLVTATGGFSGNATTDGNGAYTIAGVPPGATSVLLTPTLSLHSMSPSTRTIAGPVTTNVPGQDFTTTINTSGTLISDDFNRADETPLALGGDWQQPFGGGSVNLSGNHAVSVGGDALYYWQGAGSFDNARQFARLRVDNAGGQVGLVLLGSSGRALVVSWNLGTLYIYWYNGGSNQGPLTTTASTLQNGDVIEALLDNGIVYAKRNGVVVTSVANTTSLTSGRPGFETYQTGAALDDWEGGTPPVSAIAVVPAPGSTISTGTPCVTVPVVFSRVDAVPVVGYSVTLELSANLSLCGAQFVSAGYPLATRTMIVTPQANNRWTVDEVTLGSPCGATGSGTLFTVDVTSSDATGTGTITVVSAAARSCANQPVQAFAGAQGLIAIDREGPARTVDLVAIPSKTGNFVALPDPPHETAPVRLEFTPPPDAASVQVYRRPYGGYPQYDENGGTEPALPAALPGAGWTLTDVSASGQSDEPAARDFWYYALVTRDAHGNPSSVSNLTPGALNYYLADVSTGFATCAGDDRVNVSDVSYLGSQYGASLAVNDGRQCLDVGPTTDYSTNGRPLTDNLLNFEDLAMFGLNYQVVSAPQPLDGAATGGADRLTMESPRDVDAGEEFEVRVDLEGGGRIHALSVALTWNRAVAEPIAAKSGGVFERAGGVAFAAGPAALDGTLLGAALPGLSGRGTFATVRFRALAEGEPAVQLARVLGRDEHNRPVAIDNAPVDPGTVAASETRLLAAAPSPFVSETAIRFTLAADARVELVVFGIDGRRVRTLSNGTRPAGRNRITWDGKDEHGRAVAAGVYVTRLSVGVKRFSQLVTRLGRP